MSHRIITIGAALVLATMPVAAQERGSIEFSPFVSLNSFDGQYDMKSAIGFGGRVGAYLDPRWSIEFEGNGGTAKRPNGLADRSFRFLDGRVVFAPTKVGPMTLLLGAGVGHVDANVNNDFTDQSYGFHGLVGGRIALSDRAALRVDYTRYYNGGAQHGSLKAGFSLFRQPTGKETTVFRTVQAPATAQRADSVSAAETARLRAAAASYAMLRDSLQRNRATPLAASSVSALATMLEMINFERDKSDLDAVSRAILDDKVAIFNANPDMRIVITGYASSPGTDAYNMALGFRRATSAKAYLVSKGVSSDRIEISTRGEQNLLVAGPSDVANTANRRGQFRLLIADPYLVKP